jgi:D-alanyl-D-alanine carboxypeptidase/D-alanyl-D-alanine-endopeptidase (penicillin-binding protein 4)
MRLRILLIATCFLISTVLASQTLTDFINDPALKGAGTSAVLFDLVTDETLDSHNKDLKLCPASTWKVLSTAAASESVENLNPFKTELLINGKVEQGILKGNVIVKGYGDPTLGSEVFNENQMQILNRWAKRIQEAGINQIEGKILADATWLTGISLPRTRIWEDMANYYGTHLSGLNFHDNTYTVEFDTRTDPGENVRLLGHSPEVPYLELANYVKASTIRYDRAFIFGSPLSAKRSIRGTLPIGYDSYEIKGSIPDPALFCIFHLDKKLEEIGIKSKGIAVLQEGIYGPNQLLDVVYSPNLDKIIEDILVESNNLYAEALTARLGQSEGKGGLENGVERIREFYSKHCDSGSQIHAFDGSGLSRFNAISAQQFRHVISYCNRNDRLKKMVLTKLPRFGENGTVKNMGKQGPLKGNVAAKSGSMTGVLAYVGYLNASSGRQIGFAILINNFEQPAFQIRQKIERYLRHVFENY